MTENNHPPTLIRRTLNVWKKLVWLQLAAAFMLAAAAWYLWGWRVGELSFHESWSPKLRAELHELDACLLDETMRELVIDEISEDGIDDDEEDDDEDDEPEVKESVVDEDDGDDDEEEDDDESEVDEDEEDEDSDVFAYSSEGEHKEYSGTYNDHIKDMAYSLRGKPDFPRLYLRKSIELRDRLAHARQNLKETALKGYQPQDQRHTTTAHLAARFGKAALLRELVKRGVDINARNEDEQVYPRFCDPEPIHPSVFCTAIAGLSYADPAPLPVQVKLELLGFLLSRGADISGKEGEALYAALEAMGHDMNDKGQTLEWLFTHGITPQSVQDWSAIAYSLMAGAHMREMTQRLIQQGFLKPDSDALAYLLYGVLENAIWGGEIKDTLQWLLNDLHADPNASLAVDSGTVISRYISKIVDLKDYKYTDAKDATRHLDYLELLLAHGARLTPEEINALRPNTQALRERFDAIIRAYCP